MTPTHLQTSSTVFLSRHLLIEGYLPRLHQLYTAVVYLDPFYSRLGHDVIILSADIALNLEQSLLPFNFSQSLSQRYENMTDIGTNRRL